MKVAVTVKSKKYSSPLEHHFGKAPYFAIIDDTDGSVEFIKNKFDTYQERRNFIWEEFSELLEYLELRREIPHKDIVIDNLKTLESDYINRLWEKALERKEEDPEGAITMARTLVESVLKHLLEELDLNYPDNPKLHELYKIVAEELELTPEQYKENIFKQILGSCSAIVSGIGGIRNIYGDAHGKGNIPYKPAKRHAEFAVNISGTMCLFFIQTFKNRMLNNN